MSDVIERFNQELTPELVPDEVLDTALELPQVTADVEHFIYEGVYYRTVRVPADMVVIGAVVQIPTVVIISGKCLMGIGETAVLLDGYHVFKGQAYRQQYFRTIEPTAMTMCFATKAKTVEEAEKEMTEGWYLLQNNRTGDVPL